jgi:hypothetical protein
MFGLGEGDPSELGWGQVSQDGTTSVNVSNALYHRFFCRLSNADTRSVKKV